MADNLYRLGHFAVRRRRAMIAFWVVALIGVILLNGALGGKTTDTLGIPGTESQKAFDLLNARFPAQSGSSVQLVFAAPVGQSLTGGADATALADALTTIRGQLGVVSVTDPTHGGAVSPDARIAYAQVRYPVAAGEVTGAQVTALERAARTVETAGVRVEFGGEVISAHSRPTTSSSEAIGLLVAVVVLLMAFGSLLAMGLPIITALIGVGVGMSGIGILAAFTKLSSAAPTLATMIGLAVGIDYALFIVTRHRQNLHEGLSVEESAARANATAGGAVVFAGMTVVIALASLAVVGIPFLTVMGVAAAGTVAIAVAIAVTLMPALLGSIGHRIDRFKVPGIKTTTGAGHDAHQTLSARWARNVTRRPAIALAAGVALMAVLAVPLLGMHLGMTDAGSMPPSSTERQAYDLLAKGFGPGFNGPLTLVVDLTDTANKQAALAELTDAVRTDSDIVTVGQAVANPTGDTAVLTAVPASAPSSTATTSLVHRLRRSTIPPVEAATGAVVRVSGSTAANIDVSAKIAHALPLFMAMVIGLTMLLLLVVFRSILVPIKAAVAILLSVGGAFGVIVAVFQWGWLKSVIGLQETLPIVSFLPIMMFAILFGLSMDYEVFILSRIREDYSRTGEARPAVLSGLTASARVITAAALIMISVFASFVLGDDATIKMFGVGLGVAVLLDATIVRMVIVPAVMTLAGKAAWWLPRWLDTALPDLDVEGEALMTRLQADNLAALAQTADRELVSAGR
jgi:putative drug exporter of the RND superfamily